MSSFAPNAGRAIGDIANQGILEPVTIIEARLLRIEHDLLSRVPDIIAAILFVAIIAMLMRWLARFVRGRTFRHGRPDLGNILVEVLRWVVYGITFVIAAAMIFPGLNASTVFSTLSFISLGIGLAFRDILQNLLSGIIILIQRPYKIGDLIRVKDFEGVVETIESRATVLKC